MPGVKIKYSLGVEDNPSFETKQKRKNNKILVFLWFLQIERRKLTKLIELSPLKIKTECVILRKIQPKNLWKQRKAYMEQFLDTSETKNQKCLKNYKIIM